MADKKNITQSIDRKLSAVISILLKIANAGGDVSFKQQIEELSKFGFSSSEIADILNKKVGYVSKELSNLKKK